MEEIFSKREVFHFLDDLLDFHGFAKKSIPFGEYRVYLMRDLVLRFELEKFRNTLRHYFTQDSGGLLKAIEKYRVRYKPGEVFKAITALEAAVPAFEKYFSNSQKSVMPYNP